MSMTKKTLIAGAFLTAAGFAGVASAGAAVVYGKANISYQLDDNGTDTNWELKSNASRFGVKGKHKLEGGLQAFYKAEYEIQFDDGVKDVTGSVSGETASSESVTGKSKTGAAFTARSIEAGLKGKYGTVKAGRFDTINKKAQGKVDLFNDLYIGDIGKVISHDNRANNTLHYASPKFAETLTVKLELNTGETAGGQDGPADGVAIAIEHKGENLWATLAYTDGVAKDSAISEDDSILRAAAQFKVGKAKLGVLIQNSEIGGTKGTDYVVSAAMKVAAKDTIKVQYAKADEDFGDEAQINLGWERKLSKKVKTFAYYGTQDISDDSTIGAGMEVKF